MYKQCIIVRKDLGMSVGKTCSQVAHASMAFLTNLIRDKNYMTALTKQCFKEWGDESVSPDDNEVVCYNFEYNFDKDLYEEWINGIFTKVVLAAKNKNQLLKAKTMAEEIGLVEGKDFFLIKDCCNTELEPEEVDENGVGRCLTCIGFKPMPSEVIDKISKKYQLYK